jgi:hypothetical protein
MYFTAADVRGGHKTGPTYDTVCFSGRLHTRHVPCWRCTLSVDQYSSDATPTYLGRFYRLPIVASNYVWHLESPEQVAAVALNASLPGTMLELSCVPGSGSLTIDFASFGLPTVNAP